MCTRRGLSPTDSPLYYPGPLSLRVTCSASPLSALLHSTLTKDHLEGTNPPRTSSPMHPTDPEASLAPFQASFPFLPHVSHKAFSPKSLLSAQTLILFLFYRPDLQSTLPAPGSDPPSHCILTSLDTGTVNLSFSVCLLTRPNTPLPLHTPLSTLSP